MVSANLTSACCKHHKNIRSGVAYAYHTRNCICNEPRTPWAYHITLCRAYMLSYLTLMLAMSHPPMTIHAHSNICSSYAYNISHQFNNTVDINTNNNNTVIAPISLPAQQTAIYAYVTHNQSTQLQPHNSNPLPPPPCRYLTLTIHAHSNICSSYAYNISHQLGTSSRHQRQQQ